MPLRHDGLAIQQQYNKVERSSLTTSFVCGILEGCSYHLHRITLQRVKMHPTTIAAAVVAFNIAPTLSYVYSTQSICTTRLGPNSVNPVKTSSYVLTIPITFTKKATVTPVSTITPPPVTTTSTVTSTVGIPQYLSLQKYAIIE